MKVINPAGRNMQTEMQADYVLRGRCKCAGSGGNGMGVYSNGSSKGGCACNDSGIVQTNVTSSY